MCGQDHVPGIGSVQWLEGTRSAAGTPMAAWQLSSSSLLALEGLGTLPVSVSILSHVLRGRSGGRGPWSLKTYGRTV